MENETNNTITRVIDGRRYKVIIHFSDKSKESAQEKVRKMIKNEIESEFLKKK